MRAKKAKADPETSYHHRSASAATIAKLVIIVRLSAADNKKTEEILHYQLLTWADVELGLAIFCATAAALRPLLRRKTTIWGATSGDMQDGVTPACGHLGDRGSSPSCNHLSASGPGDTSPSGPPGIEVYPLSRVGTERSSESQDRCSSGGQGLKG
jgi:hypothetical protein